MDARFPTGKFVFDPHPTPEKRREWIASIASLPAELKAAAPYASLADAKAAGATVIAYGSFVSHVIQFVILAWVVFLMVKAVNRLRRTQPAVVVVTPPPSA